VGITPNRPSAEAWMRPTQIWWFRIERTRIRAQPLGRMRSGIIRPYSVWINQQKIRLSLKSPRNGSSEASAPFASEVRRDSLEDGFSDAFRATFGVPNRLPAALS
jgi:hypothetical protein